MDYKAIKDEAETLRKNKQYGEALPLYKQLWESEWDQGREWIGWGYAFCLRKRGKPEEALEICREVYRIKPDFDRNCSVYAWSIYDTQLKKDNASLQKDKETCLRAANAIMKLSTDNSDFSPKAKTVFKVIDCLTDKQNIYPAAEVLSWLDKLDPNHLSKDCWSGPGKDGKQIEYASDEESWYSERAKALEKLGKFEESKQIAQTAIGVLPKFHHDNDIWFNYRIAVADHHLGFLNEAQERLIKITERKKDWFIFAEMAEIAHEQGNLSDAIKLGCTAALSPGQTELEFRWKVYFLLAKLLKENGDLDLAREHALLVWKIRNEKDRKVSPDLQSLLMELDVNIKDERSAKKIERELQEAWKKTRYQDKKSVRGVIKTILPNGKSGFIRGDDGNDYYFHYRELRGDKDLFDYGIEVEFYVNPATDKGKKDSAIEIHRKDE